MTVPLPNLAWRKRPHERQVNNQQRILFSAAPHILEISVTSTPARGMGQLDERSRTELRLKLSAWATPHEGTQRLIDHAEIHLISPLSSL